MEDDTLGNEARTIPANDFIQSHLARLRHTYDSAFTIFQGLKSLSENSWKEERKPFAWQPMANMALDFDASLDFSRSATIHQFSLQTAHLISSFTRLLIQVAKDEGKLAEDGETEGKTPEEIWVQTLEGIWDGKLPEKECWLTIARLPRILSQPLSDEKCWLLRPEFKKEEEANQVRVVAVKSELTTRNFPPHRQAMEWSQIMHFTASILMHETISRIKVLHPGNEEPPSDALA